MPFPGSLKLITLTGTFLDGADETGQPRAGVVRITLPTPIRSEGDNVIIPPFDLEIDLDEFGSFSWDLPATTDPDWLPNTANYLVEVTFPDDWRKLWWMFPLPWDTAGDTLDLADVGAPNVGTPALTIRQGTSQPLADGGYKGTWGAGVLYRVGDTVQHGSAVYGALRPSTGTTPGTDATVWKVYPSSGGGGGAVSSVFGRDGDVVAQTGDYAVANITGLQAALDAKQPIDADLTAIAALTPANGDLVQRSGGVWTSQTPAQVKISLGLIKADVGLGNVDNTADANKPVSTLQAAADAQVASDAAAALAAHASDTTGVHGIADTAALALLASPAFTGTVTAVNLTQSGRHLVTPDVLTDAATIAVDASLGNDFTVTLGGNRTLGNPTNPVNGQKILFAIRQDGAGNRTLTLGSDYRLGTDVPSVTLSTAANKTDYLGVRYNATDAKWDVLAFTKGY